MLLRQRVHMKGPYTQYRCGAMVCKAAPPWATVNHGRENQDVPIIEDSQDSCEIAST